MYSLTKSKKKPYKRRRLLLLHDNFILVNFDYPGTIVSQHLVIYLIDDTFVLESGKIIYFVEVEWIDEIPVLIDQTDLDVGG
jgi:hypothetical protein